MRFDDYDINFQSIVSLEIKNGEERAVYVLGKKPIQNIYAVNIKSIITNIGITSNNSDVMIMVKFENNSELRLCSNVMNVSYVTQSDDDRDNFFHENAKESRMDDIKEELKIENENDSGEHDDYSSNNIIPIMLSDSSTDSRNE